MSLTTIVVVGTVLLAACALVVAILCALAPAEEDARSGRSDEQRQALADISEARARKARAR